MAWLQVMEFRTGNKKWRFAVCSTDDDSTVAGIPRLVEWLELLSLLGADRVWVYHQGDAGSEVEKVLGLYQERGLVQIRNHSWDGHYAG